MSGFTLLRRVVLAKHHTPTGKTRHFHGTEEIASPTELRIVQYAGDAGFYLFYCDENGAELTDTYHDSLEDAMTQAEWEFSIRPEDWDVIEVK